MRLVGRWGGVKGNVMEELHLPAEYMYRRKIKSRWQNCAASRDIWLHLWVNNVLLQNRFLEV